MSFKNLTESINEAAGALSSGTVVNLEEKAALKAACDKLTSSLETPLDVTVRIITGTHVFVATRLGVEMGIFDLMIKNPSGMGVEQLASELNADADLVDRIMRILSGINLFNDLGDRKYRALPVAGAFVSASPLSDAVVHFGIIGEILVKLPYFLAETDYKNPGDAFAGPFQYALNTKLHYFDWLKDNPKQQSAFNSTMQISRSQRGQDWFDFYPVESKLQAKSSSDTLLVDIGGGIGHDINAFKVRYPKLLGKLILQDIPAAIDDVKELKEGIELMKHDFFATQPVKGASGYYMRTVLHDWPDKQARQILENVHEAMGEHSILLINENCLPESNVHLFPAEMDFTMMAIFASLDRTEKHFRNLLNSAGFKVLKVWRPDVVVDGSATLFEAVRK